MCNYVFYTIFLNIYVCVLNDFADRIELLMKNEATDK